MPNLAELRKKLAGYGSLSPWQADYVLTRLEAAEKALAAADRLQEFVIQHGLRKLTADDLSPFHAELFRAMAEWREVET